MKMNDSDCYIADIEAFVELCLLLILTAIGHRHGACDFCFVLVDWTRRWRTWIIDAQPS